MRLTAGARGGCDIVSPTVVGADVGLSVSSHKPTDHGPAVAARVEQTMDLAISTARDDYRLAPDVCRQKVVRFGDLAFEADKDPCRFNDMLHLQLE